MRCFVAARACFAAADWLSGCCCWDPEQPPATTVTTTTKLDLIRRLRQSFDTAPILCRKADVVIELCNILDGMFQARRPRGPIWPPGSRCPECGRIVGSAHMRLDAVNFRSANIRSLNAHFCVTTTRQAVWPMESPGT